MRKSQSRYLPQPDNFFELKANKSQLQQMDIVQAAIRSFARNGLEKTTYTTLAKDCLISRTSIHYYFPKTEDLFLLAARYVRQTLLECAREGLNQGNADERRQLDGYLKGCFHWVETFPDQVKFWMLYFYQASLKGEAHRENSKLVQLGHDRIRGLLLTGKEKGFFRFDDAEATAKVVQILITGAIVSVVTETGFLNFQNITELVQGQCRLLLGASANSW